MMKFFGFDKITKLCVIITLVLALNIVYSSNASADWMQDMANGANPYYSTSVNAYSNKKRTEILVKQGDSKTAAILNEKHLTDNNVDSETAKAKTEEYIADLKNKGCYPYDKYNSVKECTLCPLFVIIFNTVSQIGDRSANVFSSGIISLVAIGFAIWLAVETLKFVSSVKAKDFKDYAQSLVTKGFLVLLAIMILRAGVGNFYKVFIYPVYNTSLTLSQSILSNKSGDDTAKDYNKTSDNAVSKIKKYDNGLPQEMGISIVKTMTMMENRVRMLSAFGRSLMCYSFTDGWFIIPHLNSLFTGFIIWVLAVSMLFVIPFLMIDAVFHLGVATLLMPFAVGAYPFDYTRKKLGKNVWDTFIVSAFTFLFITVIVLVLLGALQTVVHSSLGGNAGMDLFEKMFNPGDTEGSTYFLDLANSLSFVAVPILKLIIIFLLAWSVMKMGEDFAKEFGSGLSDSKIGSQVGTMAASVAKGAFTKAAKPVGKGIQHVGSKAAKYVGTGIKHKRAQRSNRRASKKFDDGFAKAGANATKGAKGELIYKDKKGNTFIKDSKGNITALKSSEKKMMNGTKEVVTKQEIRTKNAIITTGEVKIMKQDANGNWVQVGKKPMKERIVPLNNSAEGIMNKDGTFNPQAMSALLEGTDGDTRNKIKGVVENGIMEQRFSKAAFNPEKMDLVGDPTIIEDAKTGERSTKYVTKDGKVVITKMKMRNDGHIETTLTEIDKGGRVSILESDGIRNKETIRLLNNGVDAKSINNSVDLDNACKKDANGNHIERVGFGYTEHYKELVDAGENPDDFAQVMFGGDLQEHYDQNGNIIESNFDRFMNESATNRSMYSGNIYSDEDNKRLNQGHIFKTGNNYDTTMADMRLKFAGKNAPRNFKSIL